MRHHILLPICTVLLLTACSTDTEPARDAGTNRSVVDPSAINTPAASSSLPSGEGQRLNPPHGEPGHICEIPVGAPLDGSAAGGNTGMGSTTIQMNTEGSTTMAPGSPIQNTAPPAGGGRLNPPHGEPGHDCAVPVGEPLP